MLRNTLVTAFRDTLTRWIELEVPDGVKTSAAHLDNKRYI